MNSVMWRKLEFVSDMIDLFQNGEGAYESWTEFPAGHAQSSKGLPYSGNKLGSTIRHDILDEAKLAEHPIKEEFCCLQGCG